MGSLTNGYKECIFKWKIKKRVHDYTTRILQRMWNLVCKLKKTLMASNNHLEYDLIDLPKWRENKNTNSDNQISLFFDTRDGRKTIMIIYIDDIILTGDNFEEIERLKKTLPS